MRYLSLIVALTITAAVPTSAEEIPPRKGSLLPNPAAFTERCKSLVPQLQKKFHVPGVSMAVIDEGKVI